MASLNFKAEEIDVSDQLIKYPPIPEDIYKAVIIDSEMKPTKAGNGAYLELKFEVIDSQYEGKWIKARLNLENETQKAVEIAQRDLSSICRAIGKQAIADSEELHHKPLQIKVVIQPPRGDYPASNGIKAYFPANAPAPAAVATLPAPAVETTPAPSPAPAAAGKKPWEQ